MVVNLAILASIEVRIVETTQKAHTVGSVSIDDGNDRENVTLKMNFRVFKLCHVYSNLLFANVDKFPWC